MLNIVVLQGRLVADPELRQTQQGTPVASFRIACDRITRAGEPKQADFFSITAWRNTAEFVCKYFHKGDMILVDGRLQTNTYQDKNTGKNITSYDIVANNINFCGGKNGGNTGAAESYAQPAANYSRPAAPQAAPAYSAGSDSDFSIVDDSSDLPF